MYAGLLSMAGEVAESLRLYVRDTVVCGSTTPLLLLQQKVGFCAPCSLDQTVLMALWLRLQLRVATIKI